MSRPRELEAADAVFAAEQAVQRARRVVEEFHDVVSSALRVLDDAEFDSAKSRLSDRGDYYLEAAAEHLGRLETRCNELPNLAIELDTHLGRASHAIQEARELLTSLNTSDPALAADVAQLQPRVAILGEVVAIARPLAQLATQHVESARKASQDVTPSGLLEPQTLERSIRAAGCELGRAHEDVRLLETVVERAASQAHESVGIATEISDNARQRMATRRDHLPIASPAPAAGGPQR